MTPARIPPNSKLLQANPFSSSSTPAEQAPWSPAPPPSRTAMRAIFRCASISKQGTQSWKDEVLMIREGQCWAVDDVRYLGNKQPCASRTLRQSLEKRRFGVEATPLKR